MPFIFINFVLANHMDMDYKTATLPCGLRVIFLPSLSPVVHCGYEINAGSRDETPTEEGLAHFCEHASFKGTQHRKPWQICSGLGSVGGSLNAYTTKEDTVYYASVMSDYLGRAVDLLTDMVFHSTFPQQELDKEMEVISDEIDSYYDSPADLIYDEFENLVFEGHPLGHFILGNTERVSTFGTADARRFTERLYRPDNAVFFAYGNIDFKDLLRMLSKATADFPDKSPYLPSNTPATHPTPQGRTRQVDSDTRRAYVMLGGRAYSALNPKRMPLHLLNNILGGPCMNATLNIILRERRGLVYSVEGSVVNYADTGIWSIYFACNAEDIDRCKRLVKNELQRFASKPITESKLRAAQRQLKGQLGIASDYRENFAQDFGKSFLHYGQQRDLRQIYDSIDAVTPEDIHQVAAELFQPECLYQLIYMPKD